MKLLRPMGIVLAWTFSLLLLIAQTAAAESQGKGGKGKVAAVGIDTILLIDPAPQGGDILAEIAGGGFLTGEFTEVLLDGVPLDHDVLAGDMIHADIPAALATDGEHEVRVEVGDTNKQTAAATIRLGGEMIVSCISWFVSGPADEHLHTEVHVEDENGDPVIGAMVVWTAENDTTGLYQTNASPTYDNDGHGAGENCVNPVSGSGVTGWFCCIGAGKWDNEVPPGKRACNEGEYTARILSVGAPAFTNMVWDEGSSELEASYELIDPKFP
jgi:hypothetical protein